MKKSKHRVTFYINPDDVDGQKLVLPGLQDEIGIKTAAGHFGCEKSRIITRSRMVTDKYIKSLPEYDG
jgi:hypothetical protein